MVAAIARLPTDLQRIAALAGRRVDAEAIAPDDLDRIDAMVSSMTVQERENPDLISKSGGSRVQRIARGSGRSPQDVTGLLAQYQNMRQVMKQIGSAPGLLARLPGFKHTFVWKRGEMLLLGKMWASSDGKGRSKAAKQSDIGAGRLHSKKPQAANDRGGEDSQRNR